MRAVADTNVVVSGLLWHGPSRQLLDAARQGTVELFTSGALLAELEEVLQREKFLKRLADAQIQSRDLVTGYAALATVVQPSQIAPVVLRDPDDDAVIACAVAANAANIISGDGDLLALRNYREIEIVRVAEFMARTRRV
jgi:putative PIN family toxin of toxin-antitoxin system